jgi:hypothetical protein
MVELSQMNLLGKVQEIAGVPFQCIFSKTDL